MSILLIFENKDPQPWAKKLREKLPETLVEIYPQVKDRSAVEFAICWKAEENALKQFPNLKVIQSAGASVDHILKHQQIDENMIITRIVDKQLSNDMWEYLVAVVLAQIKNIPLYLNQQRVARWKQHEYRSIKETTVAILGLGEIGRFVAEKFVEMGFKVRGWSSSKKEILNVSCFYGQDEFDKVLQGTNFLINLLPLTDKTEGILNKSTLKKLPKGTFLINVGRGEHLEENDLIELIDNEHISGAILDVFRKEPLPKEHPFWSHPKITITPHIASLTNIESVIDQIVENYQCLRSKRELQNIVSPKKGY